MKDKFKHAFMDVAERFAQLSTAKRLQVGCILVKDDRIISIGYNGMPSGWTNECEDVYLYEDGGKTLVTKPEVLHAERNAIAKIAKSNESSEGATVFVTHIPCLECAKTLYQSGVSEIYYKHDYGDIDKTKEFLSKCNMHIERLQEGE